jgi:hypothetical protein
MLGSLRQRFDILVSQSFDFKCSLCRYVWAFMSLSLFPGCFVFFLQRFAYKHGATYYTVGGWCTLTPPDPRLKGAWFTNSFNP